MKQSRLNFLYNEMPPEWALYEEGSAMKRWAKELAGLAREPDAEAVKWAISGRGVLIEDDDTELATEIIGQVAMSAECRFVSISRDDVWKSFEEWLPQLLDPDPAGQPVMAFLEPGMWMVPDNTALKSAFRFLPEGEFDHCRAAAFRKELRGVLKDDANDRRVIFVTVVKAPVQLDEELRRAGLFDRRIALPTLTPLALAKAFINNTDPEIFENFTAGELTRIGRLLKIEFDGERRRRGLVQMALHRINRSECRKVGFRDILELSCYGTLEQEVRAQSSAMMWRTAVHEAGHVVVRYLSSSARTIPEYCGIAGRGGMLGVTVDCYSTTEAQHEDYTWEDMIESIRVGLGGRVAEHLVLGASAISVAGSRSDLERVTSMVRSMIEDNGLPLFDDTFAHMADHLMVSTGELSGSESNYNETRLRDFLQRQYRYCFSVLKDNKSILLSLAEALLSRIVLEQDEIRNIVEAAMEKDCKLSSLQIVA